MEELEKLIDCKDCSNWDDKKYNTHNCMRCNNSRKVVNPLNILCNMCGNTMCPIGSYNEYIPHGLYKAKVTGEYHSYHLFDMSTYVFSFCEECLRQLFMLCKIKPEVFTDFYNCSYDEDQKHYNHRIWRDSDGPHQKYMNGFCNSSKECFNKAKYTKLIDDNFTEECFCDEHKPTTEYAHIKLVKFISYKLKVFL